VIVFVGDSYVAPEAPGIVAFTALARDDVRALGVAGASTRSTLANLPTIAPAVAGASLVLVHLGLNDSRPSASIMHELEERLQILAPGRVVWLVPPNAPTADRAAIDRALYGARLQRLVVLPPFPVEAFRADGLHLSRAGGVLWAEALLSQLERFGVARKPAARGAMFMPVLLLGGLLYGMWRMWRVAS
jgi:hypothetical protein